MVGGALVISFVAVALEFIATTSPVFFVGKFLNGFMVGTIGTVMVSYVGEVFEQQRSIVLVHANRPLT